MLINKEEIKFIQKRRRDDVGNVFEWNGKILRGIFPEKVEIVKYMFESGFIKELIDKELFPETWITDYQIEGYGLVIEHKRIHPIIYPQEWSFEMLKDSALVILEIAKISKKYGFNMKDCHGLNILIDNNKPKFIDLGSFHLNKNEVTGWKPYKEFLRFYYYPLYMWKDGLEFVAKLSIFSGNLTSHIEHYIYKYRFLKILPWRLLDKIIRIKFLFSDLACVDFKRVENISNRKIRMMAKIFKKIINSTNLTMSQNLDRFENIIRKLNKKRIYTQWGDYHTKISKKAKRFDRIIDLINKYFKDAKTAIDIGGNQGKFAERLLKETSIKKVICQDLDSNAIDIGYKRNQSTGLNISYVNYNIMAPIVKTTYLFPWERFKSDLVVALALLHHLILSQGFSLEDILNEFKKYTSKYICIEFMPRGLWTYEQGDNYSVPCWYNVEWFKKEFEKHFQLLHFEQLAENYIVFLGKLR